MCGPLYGTGGVIASQSSPVLAEGGDWSGLDEPNVCNGLAQS
jgi:hypothetical protein